jgi:hypothetical protein
LEHEDSAAGSHFTVDNAGLVPGVQTYFNRHYGYQFLLPEKWPSPAQKNGLEISEDPDSSLALSVTTESGLGQTSSREFREYVLEAYGDVQILYEEAVAIGDINTSWTAYGYEAEEGSHTGVILPVVNDGWGHVIDLEGLSADEEILLSTARIIVDSLVLRPLNDEEYLGKWQEFQIDDYVLSAGDSFLYKEPGEGWHEFGAKDGFSFIAFRSIDQTDSENDEILVGLVSEAAGAKANLAMSEDYQVELGANEWDRIDFSYSGPDGTPRMGFIMIPLDQSDGLVVWAESTPENLASMERETFFPMLLSLEFNS